ncbi:hypothetical protein BJ138DRAFT_1107029, partial [Hygrophoropsis aurantiaca]
PDPPDQNYTYLKTRSIPSDDFLSKLYATSGQAWLDGAQSIIDPRYNEGRDRLPLWSVNLWRRLSLTIRAQSTWRNCDNWLANSARTAASTLTMASARDLFAALPWDADMGGNCTTLEFTRFLGTAWISDELEDMMMTHLIERARRGLTATISVLVGGVAISEAVKRGALRMNYTKRGSPLLYRYEVQIISLGIRKLYFPLHVNGNHWIAIGIDFQEKAVSYGDSLIGHSCPPNEFIQMLISWLEPTFGGPFTTLGDALKHGEQKDSFSCGIVTANTIAHAVFADKLWSPDNRDQERVDWFVATVHTYLQKNSTKKSAEKAYSPNLITSDETSIAVALGDPNFPDFEQFVMAGLEVEDTQDKRNSDNSEQTMSLTHTSGKTSLSFILNDDIPNASIGAHDLPFNGSEADATCDTNSLDSITMASNMTMTDLGDVTIRSDDSSVTDQSAVTDPMCNGLDSAVHENDGLLGWLRRGNQAKRSRSAAELRSIKSDGVSACSSSKSSMSKPKHTIKKAKNVVISGFDAIGTSRSAIAARKLRATVKDGTFTTNAMQMEKWKEKILNDMDLNAQFNEDTCKSVRHSACGRWIEMKEPFDSTRFRNHLKTCSHSKPMKPAAGAGTPTVSQWAKKFGITLQKTDNQVKRKVAKDAEERPKPMPCPGITEADEPLIAVYTKRTGFPGGGGRGPMAIAMERYKKRFSQLGKRQKKVVLDQQLHEHTWRNDQQNQRVYSVDCKRQVTTILDGRIQPCSSCRSLLSNARFRQSVRKKMPKDEDFVHVNYRFRPGAFATIYARTIGLKEIIETSDAKNTPCIKFALGVLSGKYKDLKVFTGLVEAMVSRQDREDRGVGMQNFKYAPAWDEFAHIMKIHSPRAFRFLSQHLPARSERSFRQRENRQPRFPMTICDETYQRVFDHLSAVSYSGSVGLSCDDTKLHPAWRLFWDSEQKIHLLVGGVGEPLRVPDPDALREAIANAKLTQATKVRLFCLQIPLPKIAPIIVAALPIASDLKAEQLVKFSLDIITGLRAGQIQIISYACDGTEVERCVQNIIVQSASHTSAYTIESPSPGLPSINLTIPIVCGQAMTMIQDSKHALKTFRNNLFSGARLLTLGNFVAIYERIRALAFEDGTPLYHRDVEKLDRQDDNAATRLFSATTLNFLTERHPDYVGEIVYLFVFGELVDAYQNRSILHVERIKMVLRAMYFQQYWKCYLAKAGYSEKQYMYSREATDIVKFLVEGLLSLVLIHRDHISGDYPLLPWLHSSEPCEHTFGDARHIVKDFTMLDFYFMVSKLRVKLQETVLSNQSPDFKARAQGYCHTYFDAHGVDLQQLARFPTDHDIKNAARDAAAECESLIALLGLNPSQLQLSDRQTVVLPGIDRMVGIPSGNGGGIQMQKPRHTPRRYNSPDSDSDTNSDINSEFGSDTEEISEALQLDTLLRKAEDSNVSWTQRQEDHLLQLTFASIATTLARH